MSTPVKASDLQSWYNRINNVRNKTGIALGSITVPNVLNQATTATQITNLKTTINALKSNTYLGKADYTAIGNVNVQRNDLIQLSTKTNIESTITSLEGICANKSTSICTDNSDYSKDSNCSDNFDDTYRSVDRSDCTDNNYDSIDQVAFPEYSDDAANTKYNDTCSDYTNDTRDYSDYSDDNTCSNYTQNTDNAKTMDCQTDYIVTGNTVTN